MAPGQGGGHQDVGTLAQNSSQLLALAHSLGTSARSYSLDKGANYY